MDQTPQIITDQDGLNDLCSRLVAEGWFAFDTEFVGEDRYQPQVCLIQVATRDCCVLIDPLGGLDPRRFWELIADEDTLVIVHAGSEDISQCRREIGRPARHVFDLQVAAGLVGLGYPISLSRLAKLILGRKIHKSQTLTDWRRRPLSSDQITYAVEDVAWLRPMYERINKKLKSLGREAWLEEECTALCQANLRNDDDEVQRLKRLKGSGSLTSRELAIAYGLLDARDELAVQYNRPARTVLKDHLLVELARRGWTSVDRIRSLRGLNLNVSAVKRLVSAIEEAKQRPRDEWPQLPSQEDSPHEEALLSLLTAVLRGYCNENSLAYSLLGKKQHLRALVRGCTRPDDPKEDCALKKGWRGAAVGRLLDQVLTGRCAIRVTTREAKQVLSIE